MSVGPSQWYSVPESSKTQGRVGRVDGDKEGLLHAIQVVICTRHDETWMCACTFVIKLPMYAKLHQVF